MGPKIPLFLVFVVLGHPTIGKDAKSPSNGTDSASTAVAAEAPRLITVARDERLQLTMGKPTVVMGNGGYQPFLFCTSRGTLFCQAQLDEKPFGTKGKRVYHLRIGTAISRDGGATWKRWTHKENHDDVFIEGGAIERKDGTIIMLDTFVMPGSKTDHGIGELWKSRDDLHSLEGPTAVDFYLPKISWSGSTDDDADIQRNYARLHRSIIEMPNGDLLALMYSQFAGDTAPSAYLASMIKCREVLVRSRDRGATWSYVSTIGVDGAVGTEGFDEGTLVRVSRGAHAGRLLCLMRTGRDLYGSHSDDDGLTWVRPLPVHFPGIDIYDTAKWEHLFVDTKAPGYVPTDEMIGNLVDPDLIEMQNGTLVCAVGVRIPARKSLFQNWRAPQNGNYLVFSLDGGDTWSHVVQYTSGTPTTHYAGVREIAKDLLYVVYDNSIWKQHSKEIKTDHNTMGFQLTVRRTDRASGGK
jgi:hypothetical protein